MRKAALLSASNPFPDQEIVWPVGKVVGEGCVKLVVKHVFPIQEKITGHNLIFMNGQEQESMMRVHESPPNILKETIGLREKTVLILPHSQVHLKKGPQFLL